MGQNNCTPSIPGLEACYDKQYIDENKLTIKPPHTLHTSMNDSSKFQSNRHYDLYQQQQGELSRILQSSKQLQSSRQLSQSTKHNIEFQNRFLKLPSQLICHVLYFIIDDYVNLLTLSSTWYARLNGAVTKTLQSIDQTLLYPFLRVKQSQQQFHKFRLPQQNTGFRLDRVLIAEVLPGYENQLVQFGYTYNCGNIKKTVWFRMAIFRRNARRTIWVGVDQSTNVYDAQTTSVVQPVLPFCVGDNIKLAINLLSLHGLIDVKSIEWLQPTFEKLECGIFDNPKHPTMLPPLRLEPNHTDWVLYQYFNHPMKRCFDDFPILKLKECRCCGISVVINRMIYQCNAIGRLERNQLNLNIVIKQGITTNEIKRATLSQDLGEQLELRVGDELILYYLRGGSSS